MRDGFYRAGFTALLASTAFLLGVLHSGGLPARAEGGTTVPAGGGGAAAPRRTGTGT